MKRKIISVMAATLIFASSAPVCLSSANAVSNTTVVSNDVCTARFDAGKFDNIVFFPEAMDETNEKYPVVVWGNGTGATPSIYYELLSKISAGGYIVVANTDRFCGSGASEAALVDFIIAENSDADSIFYNKVDIDNIGAAGHSQGGKSAVNAALRNSNIDCVFNIAGIPSQYEASKLNVPTFFMAGTNDYIVYSDLWVKPAYKKCKAPAVYASLKNGFHLTCCDTPAIYVEYALDWFDAFLKDDIDAKNVFLNGGKLSKDKRWVNYNSKNF
jgi:alpha-beta hydrolase superfamily lysophospholipase